MKTILITLMLLTQIQAQQNDSTQVEVQRKIYIALTVADMLTTGYGLSTGGRELNPLLPDNIEGIVAVKIIWLIWYLKGNPSKKELWFMNIVTAVVVSSNLYQIIKHERREK